MYFHFTRYIAYCSSEVSRCQQSETSEKSSHDIICITCGNLKWCSLYLSEKNFTSNKCWEFLIGNLLGKWILGVPIIT